MAKSGRPPIAGPIEGTFRTGPKPTSAIFEDFTRGGVKVRVRYPGSFDADKIMSNAPLAYAAADMGMEIRNRWLQDNRDADGRQSPGMPGHKLGGGMWDSMTVRIMKGMARVTFLGTSERFYKVFERESPYITRGFWEKRDGAGVFEKAGPGELKYIFKEARPSGQRVANQIKARAASKWGSVLRYNQPEALAFVERVRLGLQQRLEKELGA